MQTLWNEKRLLKEIETREAKVMMIPGVRLPIRDQAIRDLKKTTAWKWFSLYIRLRDTKGNGDGIGHCASCGKEHHYREMEAGHYVRATHRAAFWLEVNVSAQCTHCNLFLNGNEAEHRKELVRRYGEKEVLRLESMKGVPKKYYQSDLKRIAKEYRLKFKSLQEKL